MCVQPLEAVSTTWGPGPELLRVLISPGAQEAPSVPTLMLLPSPSLPAIPQDGPESLVMEPQASCHRSREILLCNLLDRQTGTDGREGKGQDSFCWLLVALLSLATEPRAAFLPDPDKPRVSGIKGFNRGTPRGRRCGAVD